MGVGDVNGDGRADVITALTAHGYGLAWYEQLADKDDKGENLFREHIIMNALPQENKYGVVFSEPHAIELVDIDGDGQPDVVVGNKKGATVLLHETKSVSKADWDAAQPKPIPQLRRSEGASDASK